MVKDNLAGITVLSIILTLVLLALIIDISPDNFWKGQITNQSIIQNPKSGETDKLNYTNQFKITLVVKILLLQLLCSFISAYILLSQTAFNFCSSNILYSV